MNNVSMPGEVKKYFEDFTNCLKNADVTTLNIELCINRFNAQFVNPDNVFLYFSREFLSKPIERMISHYEKLKKRDLSITEIVSVWEKTQKPFHQTGNPANPRMKIE
jgi:hypothetical protein